MYHSLYKSGNNKAAHPPSDVRLRSPPTVAQTAVSLVVENEPPSLFISVESQTTPPSQMLYSLLLNISNREVPPKTRYFMTLI